MARKNISKNKIRPTVGFICSARLDYRYNAAIFSGIVDAAREFDANLVCFAGGSLHSPYGFESQRNKIYNLVHKNNVDGLVIMSGALCNFITMEELKDFCYGFNPIPMVSIALEIENLSSILVDNYKGFHEEIVHLIEVHGCRRFAFIKGPETNPEAEQRYQIFTETLSEYKIPLDPNLVVTGNFRPVSGAAAIHQFLSHHEIDQNSLVNEDEFLPIGAHEILMNRGINIPDKLSGAVNFDAVVAANDNMAIGAMEELQAWGIRVPDNVAVVGFDDQQEAGFISTPLTTVRQPLYDEGWNALKVLLDQISGPIAPQKLTLPTQFVVRQSCGCHPHPENLRQQTQIDIAEKTQRLQAYQALQAEQRATALFDVGQVLITTFDLPNLLDSIAQELPRLGIPSCFLSLYDNPIVPVLGSHLIMAYNEKGQVPIKHKGIRFPSVQLVPASQKPENRRFTWIIEALYFREEQIGFVVFEAGPKEGLIYETLRGQLSSALKGALLFQEHQKAQESLEIKAKELSRSNTELEQFANIASHDLQEPLRKVLFFSDRLNSKYTGLIDEEGKDYFQRILGAVNRMQALIDDLLFLSRVTTKGQPLVHIDLRKTAQEAASDLEVLIKKTKGRVQIGDLPSIEADPAQIRQLFANLIGNSLKYHREDVPPVIKISSKKIHKKDNSYRHSFCSIFIQDNGIGFDENYIELIFQPFQRLHGRDEYEGYGIGLAVCRKIVERHHGIITAKSKPGKGSTFIITLPVRQFIYD